MSASLLTALRDVVGPGHVLAEPDARAGHERDWTGRWRGDALAVVRPADTAQVAATVRACADAGAVVITQGGNSGLVGGGVPRPAIRGGEDDPGRPQVVLSTRRLHTIHGVDTAIAQLHAGAGVTLADAQSAARAAGLELALDLGARDSATLGGLAACDAGGLRALRHGTARRQIAGVEAVLADGSTIESRMHGLVKDTAGYDLGALLVGSEGTLGVITAVRWTLAARRGPLTVALVGLDSVADAVALVAALRPRLATLELCELMLRDGIDLVLAHLGQAAPTPPAPVNVLLGCAAPEPVGDGEKTMEQLAAALDAAGVAEQTVSPADASGAQRLLTIRERHADALVAQPVEVIKLDVGVPLEALAPVADAAPDVAREVDRGARTIVFGHLGDGNLHVNVVPSRDLAAAELEAMEDALLTLVAGHGGTVSAEHGIGVHKRRHVALTRSEAEITAMRAIKRALDPAGTLNPGVGLP